MNRILSRSFSSAVRDNVEALKQRRATLLARLEALELPEKYKGTIWEKWAMYWKNLVIDYKEMIVDTGKTMRERPIRSSIYLTLLGASAYCSSNNPDEADFMDQFRRRSNELSMVHPSCQNPQASEHIQFVQRAYNEGIVRRISLGVVSFMWLDNYDRGVAIYKAICPYLQPRYVTFHERIIDVGFNKRWWMLERKMIDYDINDASFEVK
ncbi:mitochondrial import inner membrane translocase subunit Tim29 [Uranotaenia lowii]|uniref:mitochondrial import inner membrane translocase subunit Tim29 n=1 Tax=Uranotaenia lowii TaxID=190385 RepID=UPI0024797F96|nr:mitochondrial import inner membrane translocase subunit Tim29 [Uranotaenia lowii]